MERASTRRSSLNLSDLPKNVIQEILSRLPIKEAGRTSILSRSWRCRWRSITNLHISGLYPSRIYQLLLLHSGSIRVFKAEEHLSDTHPIDEWDDSDLMRYLHILSLNSASTLHTLCITSFHPHCYIDTIASSFPNLTHLHFTGSISITVYPSSTVFSSLKSMFLHIDECTDDISVVISSCPLLEDLRVTFTATGDQESTRLDIVSPSLRWLKLSGISINGFAVTSSPVLETVHIVSSYYDVEGKEEADKNSVGGARNDILMKIFGGMASVEELELDEKFVSLLGSGHVAERIPITFGNLKNVSLKVDFCSAKAVLGVLCLLGSTPVLRVLEIRVRNCLESPNKVLDAGHGLWEAQEHLFNKLEIVVMTNIACQKTEMGFIKFLLAKSEILKDFMIGFHHLAKRKDAFMIELWKFPRLSHQAQFLLARSRASGEEEFTILGAQELACPECWYII